MKALAVALLLLAVPGPVPGDIVAPAAACVGTATWASSGVPRSSAALSSGDVIEIPRADTVAWTGKVVGPAPGAPRPVAGRVALRLPPPLGSIGIASWTGSASVVEKSGSYRYDLPSLVPSGVRLDLLVSHEEGGRRYCTASVGLIIPGGPFDSPLIWAALALALASLGGLLLLGRSRSSPGRLASGAVVGLLFGVFAGLTLVLLGVLPLASLLVSVLAVVGLIVGLLWTFFAPLARTA